MMRQEKKSTAIKGPIRVTALCCAIVFSFAGLVACSRDRQSPPATATVPVTVTEVLRVDVLPAVSQTATFSSTELGITLQYPATWQPGNSNVQMYDPNDIDLSSQPLRSLKGNPDVYTYGDDDGYVIISGAGLMESSASTVCEAELRSNILKQNRYGQHPVLEEFQIDGQSACLIMPSDDQPESERGRALLVWQHPDAAVRSRTQRAVLVLLVADKRHIRDIGASLKFTGPRRQWTPDPSTPAAPAHDVKHFVSDYGVRFDYPANWFTYTKEAENVIIVMNAPPDGIYALKQGGDFRAISVGLKPADMTGYESVRAYIDATFLGQCFECKVLAIEALPPLPHGYTVTQLTFMGEGEREVRFIANGQHILQLSTTYTPGKRSEAKYLEVFDQIAATLVIP